MGKLSITLGGVGGVGVAFVVHCVKEESMVDQWRTSNPGSYALMPSCSAFSMSIVPHIRSSVAPRGSSTCSSQLCLDWQLGKEALPW